MSESAEELYLAGLKKHRNKDYEGAIVLLGQAVASDPRHVDSWEALGVLFEKNGRLDEAIAAMQKLAELVPDSIMAHTNLSRFYMKKGMKEKAEEEQSKARILGWKQELASGGAQSGLDMASKETAAPTAPVLADFLQKGTPAAAAPSPALDPAVLSKRIEQFERIVAANVQDVMSRLTLGKAYIEARRFDDAARVLQELLAIKEDYSAAYSVLGEAFEKGGKLARAIKTYTKGIEVADKKGDLHPRNQMEAQLQRLTATGSA